MISVSFPDNQTKWFGGFDDQGNPLWVKRSKALVLGDNDFLIAYDKLLRWGNDNKNKLGQLQMNTHEYDETGTEYLMMDGLFLRRFVNGRPKWTRNQSKALKYRNSLDKELSVFALKKFYHIKKKSDRITFVS